MEITLNSEKIAKFIAKGISIEGYIVINLVKSGETEYLTTIDTTRYIFDGFLNTSEQLTPKAKKLIEELEGIDWNNKAKENLKELTAYQQLYVVLQNKLAELTGKKQKLIGGKYYFMPSYIDFQSKLSKVVKKYELKDWNKLEKVLINYVVRAKKSNFEMIQLLGYYIEKNNSSTLATDYENYVEGQKDESKQINSSEVII